MAVTPIPDLRGRNTDDRHWWESKLRDGQVQPGSSEIGHGFEEGWRKRTNQLMQEAMAETIRNFVEVKMGLSKWSCPSALDKILSSCNHNLDSFKKMLKGDSIYKLFE